MANRLLADETLKGFIEIIGLNQGQKSSLLEKLPQMDEEERRDLFNLLKDIYLLDLEEKESIERIKRVFASR
jgi:hypothetical protein